MQNHFNSTTLSDTVLPQDTLETIKIMLNGKTLSLTIDRLSLLAIYAYYSHSKMYFQQITLYGLCLNLFEQITS